MKLEKDAKLLRIFIGESDKYGQRPLYEAIVYAAKKKGMAGATVTKGVLSYGANSKIHTLKIFALSEDLPVIIEIVDEVEKIEEFNEIVDKMFKKVNCGGLITVEKIKVLKYDARK
ncbi:MAG: DUF190 domain-containing protein [Chlorobi bacterium]|nr:DUF190 domain-containing protein [Chlorobiota bacterium]